MYIYSFESFVGKISKKRYIIKIRVLGYPYGYQRKGVKNDNLKKIRKYK